LLSNFAFNFNLRPYIKEQSSKNQLKKMEELAALEAKAKVGQCRLTPVESCVESA